MCPQTVETIENWTEVFWKHSLCFAVAEGNQELLDDIDPVIERLRNEGKVSEFSDKHAGGGT